MPRQAPSSTRAASTCATSTRAASTFRYFLSRTPSQAPPPLAPPPPPRRSGHECSYRYMLALVACDASGSQWLTAFNEQATSLLGKTAHELKRIKDQNQARPASHANQPSRQPSAHQRPKPPHQRPKPPHQRPKPPQLQRRLTCTAPHRPTSDPSAPAHRAQAEFEEILNRAKFQPLTMRLRAKKETYQGNTRVKVHVVQPTPTNFVTEGKNMLAEIAKYNI
eukprot:2307388-Prymnesium_polylepis.3